MHHRIRLDCRGKSADEILAQARREMAALQGEPHVVLCLDSPEEVEGSWVGLLKGLLVLCRNTRFRASIVDPTGCAAFVFDKLGGAMDVEVFRDATEAGVPKEILLVEDNEDNLQFLKTALETARHRVTVARDGREALHHHERARFDVALVDLVLPDMDGMGVASIIADSGVPVIVISAYLERWGERDFHRAGVKRQLRKPFKVAELLEAVGGKP